VEGGSLGGARSPRPHCKAELAPRRSVSITWVNEGTRPNGDMSGASGGLPCGRAEPAPPRGGPSELGWPCGENPGIMWGVVLSEGRGLRARTVRPDEWQGIALPPVPFREAGGQEGAMLGVSVMPPFRACGARPSQGWTIQARMALRRKAGDNVGGGSLGGARSPRPHGTAGRMARHCVATGAFPRSRWPRRGNVGVSVMPSFRACGARPSQGWTIQARMALRWKARGWRERRSSRRGAVSAPARYGRTNGKALRCHRCLSEKPVAKKGQCWG
jgi:hypothetical protein